MPNPRAPFKQADVTRAAKGALAAGLPVERLEICSDGKIIVFVQHGTSTPINDWD